MRQGDGSRPGDKEGLSRDVVAMIRELLVSGELKRGEPLRQVTLARRVGASRAPIREALHSLEAVGLVEWTPNAGFRATALTFREYEEICRMRDILESDAIRQTFRRGISHQTIWKMKVAHEQELELAPEDILKAIEINRQFHFPLMETVSRHQLRIITQLWELVDPYRVLYYGAPERFQEGIRDHAVILEAVIAGDEERAVQLTRHHRQHGVESLAGVLA